LEFWRALRVEEGQIGGDAKVVCHFGITRIALREVPRAGHSSFGMPTLPHVSRKAAEILLVEDNAGDIRLMEEAFREAGCYGHLLRGAH
jgi:hypothetical protein